MTRDTQNGYTTQVTDGTLTQKGYIMETWFSVLSLMLGVVRAAFMWLNYKESKRKRTQIATKQSHKMIGTDLPIISVYPFHDFTTLSLNQSKSKVSLG